MTPGIKTILVEDRNITGKTLVAYDQDSSFISSSHSQFSTENISQSFSIDSIGQTVYFKVYPSNLSDSLDTINLKVLESDTLFIHVQGNGGLATDTILGLNSLTFTNISAINNAIGFFSHWSLDSGAAIIDDVYALNTTIQGSGNVWITAHFRDGLIHNIGIFDSIFNYKTDAYDSTDNYSGVYFKYQAPQTNIYKIGVFNDTANINKRLYAYGTDSTFTNQLSYASSYDSTSYEIWLDSGETTYLLRTNPKA